MSVTDMDKPIRLEPHSAFKDAIQKVDSYGVITYSHHKLVSVCMKLHGLEYDDALDWVEYNIVSLATYGFRISYRKPPGG
jgi:hypothetical protein